MVYVCGGLSWLLVSFVLHVKYIIHTVVSYRIAPYRFVYAQTVFDRSFVTSNKLYSLQCVPETFRVRAHKLRILLIFPQTFRLVKFLASACACINETKARTLQITLLRFAKTTQRYYKSSATAEDGRPYESS